MRPWLTLTLKSIASVLGWVGQGVGVPLFLATFLTADGQMTTGPYFVVLFCSVMFNLVYWPAVVAAALKRRPSPLAEEDGQPSASAAPAEALFEAERAYLRTRRGNAKLLAIGVCNGLNGLLQVYASSTTRVPGALQPILLQSTLLFTVIGSRVFLGKRYPWGQLGAVALVVAGMATALAPTLVELRQGNEALESGPMWPFVLVLACAPAAAMNLVQESVFDDVPSFSLPLLLALTSLWQAVAVALLWWTDVLPSFGTSPSLGSFGANLSGGFGCFFAPAASANPARCALCAPLGLFFVLSYAAAYYFGAAVVRLASANLQSLLTTFAFFSTVYVWLALPAVNTWSGGKSYSTLDIATTSAALVPIAAGTALFRYCEPPSAREKALQLRAVAGGAPPEGEPGGRLTTTLLG